MSVHARPEVEAVRELESLVHTLGEQLASYRQRALTAEERLRHIDASSDHPGWRGLRRLQTTAEGLTLELTLDDLDPFRAFRGGCESRRRLRLCAAPLAVHDRKFRGHHGSRRARDPNGR